MDTEPRARASVNLVGLETVIRRRSLEYSSIVLFGRSNDTSLPGIEAAFSDFPGNQVHCSRFG